MYFYSTITTKLKQAQIIKWLAPLKINGYLSVVNLCGILMAV
jgi:hypothetical protein